MVQFSMVGIGSSQTVCFADRNEFSMRRFMQATLNHFLGSKSCNPVFFMANSIPRSCRTTDIPASLRRGTLKPQIAG